MRGEEGVRGIEQRRVGGRLVLEDIDPGAAEVTGLQCLGHGRLVHDAAACDIEDDRARLELGDRIASDQAARRARERDVDGHDVGAGEERVEVDELDPVVRGLLGGHERVDAHDHHLHRPRAVCDGLPDLAEADDAEGPAAQLESGELRPLPFAPADRRVGGRGLARDPVEERERVLRSGDGVAGRRVDDGDPGSRRRVEIDVVHAHAGAPDDHQPRPGRDQLGIHLDLAAHDERVVLGQDRRQFVARAADPLVDLVVRREELDALARDGFGDQDPHAVAPAVAVAAMP